MSKTHATKANFAILRGGRSKLILATLGILFFSVILAFTFSTKVESAENSVVITSDNWVEAEKPEDLAPGSWKVVKSAEWTSVKTAKITFDITTAIRLSEHKRDIVFVLDTSGSMRGDKLTKLQKDASELVEYILKDTENQIALVNFSTKSQILTGSEGNYFTNDSREVLEKLASIEAKGGTNYAAALRNVAKVVDGYAENPNRDLIVMFLTDGYPAEENPNQITEYLSLKEKYPFMEINGIQYEMNNRTVIKQITEISDNQYLAYQDNLKNVLMEATLRPGKYEEFEITDYINDKFFTLASEEDVEATLGKVDVDLDNQTLKWDLGNLLVSGNTAKLTIDVNLKEPYDSNKGLYPTNKGENLKIKLESLSENEYYNETPVLQNYFDVVYNANAPEGCNIQEIETKSYFIYENVKISDSKPICSGYLFKGWEIVEDDVQKVNDTEFIMPVHKVTIGGQWTKVGINKSFNGDLVVRTTLWKQVQSDYLNTSKVDKGAKMVAGTDGEGYEYPIYYYNYGSNQNQESATYKHKNYVYYAGLCWKIARTTETGGVKLLYYGTWEENTCKQGLALSATGSNMSSAFNSSSGAPSYVGYMYDKIYSRKDQKFTSTKKVIESSSVSASSQNYYGTKVNYVEGTGYVLEDEELKQWKDYYPDLKHYYTCMNTVENKPCTSIRYILGTSGSSSSSGTMYYVMLKDGQTIDDVNIDMIMSEDYIDHENGTYSLDESKRKTVKLFDWYANYSTYKNHYICPDYTMNTGCSSMYYITSPSSYQYTYIDVANNYKYGNDYKINSEGKYELIDTDVSPIMQFWNWDANYNNLTKNHYTCFNTSGICDKDEIYYLYYMTSSRSSSYSAILKDGKKIENLLNEMVGYEDYEGAEHIDINQTDSTIKKQVDLWYERNIKDTEDEKYLENTIFCNDRRIANLGGWDPNGTSVSNNMTFYSNSKKDLSCGNLNDKFTVNDTENKFTEEGEDILGGGNGKLKYPVGLLTAGEQSIMGSGNAYYNGYYWLGSPNYFNGSSGSAYGYYVYSGSLYLYYVSNAGGVRPAVSLKPGVEYINAGDGTITNPYRSGERSS